MPVSADPAAQFENPDVIVTFGSQEFTIPAQSAATWLSILTANEPDGAAIFPGLLPLSEQSRVDDVLLSGEVDLDELVGVIRDVVTVVSGHPWWWTFSLLSILWSPEHGTQYLGEMARVDASTCSLGLWLNALYALAVKYMKEEDRTKFDMELDTPPPDVEIDPEDLIDEAASSAAFMSMMGTANG